MFCILFPCLSFTVFYSFTLSLFLSFNFLTSFLVSFNFSLSFHCHLSAFSPVLSLTTTPPKPSFFLSLLSCLPHSMATGDYSSRPEGGARTQRAERDGAGIFHLSNENITGDPVGGDDLWRALHFRLACSLFRKMPGHPSHPLPSSAPGRCGSATATHRELVDPYSV